MLLAAAGATALGAGTAHASAGAQAGEVLPILEALVLILLGARLGGALFERFGQSAVLGELAAGIVIGNLGLLGWHGLDGLRALPALDLLAEIGVLFLLFEVGLKSDVRSMMAVGGSSFLVATLGVIAPIGLGYLASSWLLPSHHPLTHWFVGATLCATSVGITARVLSDLGRVSSPEGRIVLGAAVIDDVMGLLVLAVVTGVIAAADRGVAFAPASVLWIVGKSVLFLGGALLAGGWLSRHAFRIAARLPGEGLLLSLSLAFCFALAWLAGRAGLAPIVGAFAAGLIVDEAHYRELRTRDSADRSVEQLLQPLMTFLVPVFFVLMGMRVDLAVFGAPGVIGFAAVLCVVAVASKQACSLGVIERGVDRLAVGLGMIPRGEVGLIFASIGATLAIKGERVVDPVVFSAVVVMVAVTTLLTPPLLTWRMRRRQP